MWLDCFSAQSSARLCRQLRKKANKVSAVRLKDATRDRIVAQL